MRRISSFNKVRAVVMGLAVALACTSAPVRASDFWDEVRTPGLRAFRVLLGEAEEAFRAGRNEEALNKADSAISRFADRARAHVLRGRALGRLGRYGHAVLAFERALGIDVAALDATDDGAEAARFAARASAYDLAARILARVLGRMRDNSARRCRLFAMQGDILQILGPDNLRPAIVAYRAAGQNSGRSEQLQAALGLALALHRDGKTEEALQLAGQAGSRKVAERAVKALPLPTQEREARMAVVLEALGDPQGARRAWQRSAAEGPWQRHAREALDRLDRLDKRDKPGRADRSRRSDAARKKERTGK